MVTSFFSDNFNDIAIFEFSIDSHHFSVNLCPRHVITNIGMNRVRKINRRGFFRKIDHISFWSKYKYAILKEIHLEIFKKFTRFRYIFLTFNKLIDPKHIFFERLSLFSHHTLRTKVNLENRGKRERRSKKMCFGSINLLNVKKMYLKRVNFLKISRWISLRIVYLYLLQKEM